MSKSEARRQKQLAKKKAKRDEKRHDLARQTSDNPLIRLAAAATWPVLETLIPEELWDRGMGSLVFARRMPDGRIAASAFLVDTLCLGVKNAFWRIFSGSEYGDLKRKTENSGGLLEPVPADYFAKLLQSAVAYAQSFGFPPHPDYNHARMLLAGIDPSTCTDTFEFGRDGKPFFISGPYDSPAKIKMILHRLEQEGGHFVVQADQIQEMELAELQGKRAWRQE